MTSDSGEVDPGDSGTVLEDGVACRTNSVGMRRDGEGLNSDTTAECSCTDGCDPVFDCY